MTEILEGKDFWSEAGASDDLIERSRSVDSFERWAAALELGERGDDAAVARLRELLSDDDEFVRQASESALEKLGARASAQAADGHASCAPLLGPIDSEDDLPAYVCWKIRPLAMPTKENAWAVDAAVAEMVDIEGPVRCRRLFRIYADGVEIRTGKRLAGKPIAASIRRLIEAGRVVRCDDFSSEQPDDWIVHRRGTPEICARQRGRRDLRDIPVNEVREVLLASGGVHIGGRIDRDKAFQRIIELYRADRELHLLGGLLAKEWALLLR